MKYKVTEYKIGNAIVRMHDPNQTPEEKEQQKERIRTAAIRFLQKVIAKKRRQQRR